MLLEPCCGLALVGVPLMALKIPRESESVFLLPSSTGLIWKRHKINVKFNRITWMNNGNTQEYG